MLRARGHVVVYASGEACTAVVKLFVASEENIRKLAKHSGLIKRW